MMSEVKETNLRDLLDGFLTAHRKDILDYSSGHLNEANLYKPPKKTVYKTTWLSSAKPVSPLNTKSKMPTSKEEARRKDTMRSTMRDFSIGTAGTKTPKSLGPLRSPLPSATSRDDSVSDKTCESSLYSKVNDNVLVEEMKIADTMLNRPSNSKAWAQEDFRHQAKNNKTVPQGKLKDDNLVDMLSKHQFYPSHIEAVTKKDQFQKFKNFESTILKKQDAMEQNVLTGVKAVEHLENKLKQDLDNLPYDGYGPNFHRLQLYSSTFDDLISDSPTFGFILKTIKQEYDAYISSLLDGQRDRHRVLYKQAERLSSHGTSNPEVLDRQMVKVHSLQREARDKLEENERLRREVQQETELASQPEAEEAPKHTLRYREEPEIDISEQIEMLRTIILEKLDALKELKMKLRTEYVPSTVVQHLEQCIKETEVEIQKLTSSRDYFEQSISDMEKDLQDAIEHADTTERDARRVWKKVTAVKSLDRSRHRPGAGRSGSQADGDSDSEDDDSKWSWYIS